MTTSTVSSSSNSTAWQTALSSARQSNVTNSSSNASQPGGPPPSSAQPAPSSYATMARIAAAGGFGTPSALPPRRPPSSSASSSSSFSPSSSSLDAPLRSFHASSSAASQANTHQSSSGWRGSANVPRSSQNTNHNQSARTYGDALSRSSSRSSSAAAPSSYRNTTLPRNSSHSGLSGMESDGQGFSSRSIRIGTGRDGFSSSRSQTSVESDDPEAIIAQQHNPVRPIVSPNTANTSEWENAFKSLSVDGRKKAKDEEELAAGIAALGLNPDLTEKVPFRSSPSHPPPPSTGAWSFKHNTTSIPRGQTVDPERLAGPKPEYLEIAAKGSTAQSLDALTGKRPKLLVLDLNQTLVTRKKATSQGARNATPRPYLSAFLEYICGSDEVSPGVFQRRFNVMIWSSAEAANVNTMCENMSLFTDSGTQAPLLVDVWDRSSMDLTLEQFNSKYPTMKDLTKIWKIVKWNPLDPASPNPALLNGSAQAQNGNAASASSRSSASSSASSVASENGQYPTPAPSPAPSMASSSSSTAASGISTTTSYSKKDLRWSQLDTILIDDSPSKAVLQPYNHLHIMSWKPPTRSAFASPPAYGAPHTSSSSKTQDRSDNCLLQAVAMLERLRRHTNVSAAIRSGQFQGLTLDERGDAWAKEGVEVLNKKGIKHPKDFDSTWAKRVLAQTALPTASQPGRSSQASRIGQSPTSTNGYVGWD